MLQSKLQEFQKGNLRGGIGVNEADQRIYNFLKKHNDEIVDIGVVHTLIPNRLFFQMGKVLDLNQETVLLETKRGLKKFEISEIQEVRVG